MERGECEVSDERRDQTDRFNAPVQPRLKVGSRRWFAEDGLLFQGQQEGLGLGDQFVEVTQLSKRKPVVDECDENWNNRQNAEYTKGEIDCI